MVFSNVVFVFVTYFFLAFLLYLPFRSVLLLLLLALAFQLDPDEVAAEVGANGGCVLS